jgi:hypothetical protein
MMFWAMLNINRTVCQWRRKEQVFTQQVSSVLAQIVTGKDQLKSVYDPGSWFFVAVWPKKSKSVLLEMDEPHTTCVA